MDNASKQKLYAITFILDLFLFWLLYNNKLVKFDLLWCISVIVCHILFYFSLLYYNKYLIDKLHAFVFILPVLSFFSTNIYIKICSCLLLILIQILWINEKRCILNEKNEDWGYGDQIGYFSVVFTPILAMNIGYLFNK